MGSIVLLCTDGSDASIDALRVSLPLLAPADRTIVLTVELEMDAKHTTGRGFSATASSEARIETDGDMAAKDALDRTVEALNLGERLGDVEQRAIVGSPGPAICEFAAMSRASVVVIGSSGKSGLRRAVLGSTSDYVVRHAVCPVLVQGVGT